MSKKILIVEDNVDLLEIYKFVLEKENFDVLTAENGIQAKEILKKNQPDIILLDILMPYINGFEFLSEIREQGNSIKVVINSNIYQESEIKKGFELGADEYFRKIDYTPYELADKLKEFLETKKS